MAAVVMSGLGVNVWILEGVVMLMAAAFVVLAVLVWKKNHKPASAPVEEEPVTNDGMIK